MKDVGGTAFFRCFTGIGGIPGSLVRAQDPVDAVQAVYCLSSTGRRLLCSAKGRKCLSVAAIHQSLATIQKVTLKIVLPPLTYLSPLCVQVVSVQFIGANRISFLFYL